MSLVRSFGKEEGEGEFTDSIKSVSFPPALSVEKLWHGMSRSVRIDNVVCLKISILSSIFI